MKIEIVLDTTRRRVVLSAANVLTDYQEVSIGLDEQPDVLPFLGSIIALLADVNAGRLEVTRKRTSRWRRLLLAWQRCLASCRMYIYSVRG